MKAVSIKNEFYHRLANRDENQGDGHHTAIEFRTKFLKFLDDQNLWNDDSTEIVLDFEGVKKIGPSFANEVFAYFAKYASPERICSKIKFINISKIQKLIIEQEITDGYKR